MADDARSTVLFRMPANLHGWLKRTIASLGISQTDWLVEAVQEKLERAGVSTPETASMSPGATLFGREMAELYAEVEGTDYEMFLSNMRDQAATLKRITRLKREQERKAEKERRTA